MLIGRADGPLTLRLILQPTVAAIFAIRSGLREAGEGWYFFWSVFTHAARRPELLGQVWKDVGRVFIIAVVLDVNYELIVYRWVYSAQAAIVATVLAIRSPPADPRSSHSNRAPIPTPMTTSPEIRRNKT